MRSLNFAGSLQYLPQNGCWLLKKHKRKINNVIIAFFDTHANRRIWAYTVGCLWNFADLFDGCGRTYNYCANHEATMICCLHNCSFLHFRPSVWLFCFDFHMSTYIHFGIVILLHKISTIWPVRPQNCNFGPCFATLGGEHEAHVFTISCRSVSRIQPTTICHQSGMSHKINIKT